MVMAIVNPPASGPTLLSSLEALADEADERRAIIAEPDPEWIAHVDPPSGPAPKIPLLDGPALAAPLPPLEYLVREIGLVAGPGAPHLIAGYGFSGKTLAAQSCALSLAAGQSVWGSFRSTSRRVLHVDLEQGDRLTRRRYQRLAAAMGVDLSRLGDALAVVIMPQLTLSAEHAHAWRQLMAGRDLIIIDSLRAATAGADENDSGIRAGLDMLGTLSEATGCRPLVIHHARKPGTDDTGGRYAIRGSSAIYDAADSVYVFCAGKAEPVLVSHAKARSHGEPTEDIALVIEDVEIDRDQRAGLRVVVRGAELVAEKRDQQAKAARLAKGARDGETVRAVIAATPGIGSRALRERLGGWSGDRVRAAIESLGASIQIRDEVNGRTRTAGHYLRGAS